MKNIEELITVGIPFYSGTERAHLILAIESIINQSLIPSEIQIIQDGPICAGLKQIVDEYAYKYKNIKNIIIESNMGLTYALNISIINTKTKYYARMDSDDISHPNRIEKQVRYLESNPKIDILGTWLYEFDFEITSQQILDFDDFKKSSNIIKTPVKIADIKSNLHYKNPLAHMSVMFRKDVFAKIGLYNVKYRRTQDLELWTRAVKNNIGIYNLPEPLIYARVNNLIEKRSKFSSIIRQTKIRYSYNTTSPKLNLLKILSIIFRLLPIGLRKWGYKKLR